MNRERDLDALAEAMQEEMTWRARLGRWASRLAGRFLVRAIGPGLFAGVVCVLLAQADIDPGSLLMPTVAASPFLLVAVASFVRHAWRQNTGLTYVPPATELDLATEPGQPVGQPIEVGQVAGPVEPTTVTVTVLPAAPVAALPRAVGQAAPVHYAEEETRG